MDKIDFTPLEKAIKSLDEIIERYRYKYKKRGSFWRASNIFC